MAITEKSRNELRKHLEDTMGEERATTLMEHLPPVGWADVATRQDLDQLRAATRQDIERLRAETRHDIERLRAETRHDIEQLRTEIEQLRGDTQKDFAHLRELMDYRFEAVNARLDSTATQAQLFELRTELHQALRTQTIWLMATNLTMFGLVVAVLKLA